MTAEELWKKYTENSNINECKYQVWAFGGPTDLLADLVIRGEKTATTSAYSLYELENEPLPKVGEYSIILNSKEEAVCIIQTTKVYLTPFCEVSEKHAYKEGEGDKSLLFWRDVHKSFFSECLSKLKVDFNESMKVVCEEFKVVYMK